MGHAAAQNEGKARWSCNLHRKLVVAAIWMAKRFRKVLENGKGHGMNLQKAAGKTLWRTNVIRFLTGKTGSSYHAPLVCYKP